MNHRVNLLAEKKKSQENKKVPQGTNENDVCRDRHRIARGGQKWKMSAKQSNVCKKIVNQNDKTMPKVSKKSVFVNNAFNHVVVVIIILLLFFCY
ncbi:hypothetical protein BMS3Abin03_01799 [bacterium BMS3Abin03]|nr:hypothetical protein BMS3Abin03_01799 [bacterium BMS3Abin03]